MGDILGYTRVSTADQDGSGQACRLSRHGATRLFSDICLARATYRPGLAALLGAAKPGDTLAVVGLDRLGRSVSELLAIVTMLRDRGIALVSLEDKLDTNSADGAVIFAVFGAVAACERRLTAERAKAGAAAARSCGKRRGRPPLEADKITAALKLIEAGLSPAAAARKLRVGRSTIYREVSRAARSAASRGADAGEASQIGAPG